ncbi:hypothetical protein Leryth_026845 [Lithospermum erythrorhizon]|nr:hypothetical protein Leryth_026845 [Lithospermum erythrorhizon]
METLLIFCRLIAGQLKNRIQKHQVQIAGRIDGKEIARVEWIREGRVPLQTIRAKIDYCCYTTIEAGRRAMTRNALSAEKLRVRIFSRQTSYTKTPRKPDGFRKGSPEYWVAVKPGRRIS